MPSLRARARVRAYHFSEGCDKCYLNPTTEVVRTGHKTLNPTNLSLTFRDAFVIYLETARFAAQGLGFSWVAVKELNSSDHNRYI